MPTYQQVQVRGLEELQASLRLLPQAVETQLVDAALRQAARVTLSEVKRRVPQPGGPGKGFATGKLKAALTIRKRSAGDLRGVHLLSITAKGAVYRLLHLIEFGTRDRGAGTKHHTGVMPPQPFMRPALDATAGQAIQAFADAARRYFPSVVARVAGRQIGREIRNATLARAA